MTKFKIFFGMMVNPADEQVNAWLEKHPEVDVIAAEYQQTPYGHSICVMYEEDKA